jgi:hypothetical protein
MARKKPVVNPVPEPTPPPPPEEVTSLDDEDGDRKVNKMDSVRKALDDLGVKAKPRHIQVWLRENLDLEMDTGMISSYKSSILRKQAGASGKQPVRRGPAVLQGFSLPDIEAVKALADRIGAEQLRQLIDVLAR